MALRLTPGFCDRGGCPAPACREFLVYGQDFRFCNHHAVELLEAVGGDDSVVVEIIATPARAQGPRGRRESRHALVVT